MNKIILLSVVLCTACKANHKMIENFQPKPVKEYYDFCFERFLKERLIRNEIILYRIGNESLYGVTKQLMDFGFTVIVRSCYEYKEKCAKNKDGNQQFLINAVNAQELDYIIMKCICEWTSETQFVIMTPSTEEVFNLLKVLQKHIVPTNRATVVTFGENILHYRRGLPRCTKNYYINETFIYDCLNPNSQVNIKANVKDFLQCDITYGVRVVPPFTIKPNEKQMLFMPGAKYIGVEIALLGKILELPNTIRFEASDINDLGTYNQTTGKRTGLLKELEEGRVDILLGAIYIEECIVGAEFTYPMFGSELVAITKRQKAVRLFRLFTVFDLSLWLLILGIAVSLLFIITYVLRRNTKLDIVTSTFYLLAALMGKGIPLNNKSLKLLLPIWIYLAIFLRICFEAQTMKRLTKIDADKQIDKLYDLCSKNFTIYVTELYYPFIKEGFNFTDCNLPSENIILDNDPLERLYKEEGNVATMMYVDHYLTYLSNYAVSDKEEPFHVAEEIVKRIPFVFCHKNGDPIGKVLKDGSEIMVSRGFVKYFLKSADSFRLTTIESLVRDKTEDMSLGLGQTAPAFYLYFIGIFISFIAFAVEIIMIVKFSKPSILGNN